MRIQQFQVLNHNEMQSKRQFGSNLIVFKLRESKTSQSVNAVAAFNSLNKNSPLPG